MNDGKWKEIQYVKVGDEIELPEGGSAFVKEVFDNGEQEIVKIHLEDGTFFECTEEHRWYVYNHISTEFEWVQTKNLEHGEYSMIYPE